MKVVQLLPSFAMGGAEVFAVTLGEALRAAGHEVHLVVLSDAGPLRSRLGAAWDGRVTVVPKRARFDATVLPRLVAVLRHLRPDVVHAHLFTALAWGAVASAAARVPAFVYTEHAAHDDEYPYLAHVRRALSPLVSAVVGCSPAVMERLERDRLAPGVSAHLVGNGIVVAGRPRATLDGVPLRIGTVGRLVAIKGQAWLVRAVARVRDAGVDVRLVIVGDGPLRAELEAERETLGLGEVVELAGAQSDVDRWMAGFDLFVLPSLSEALPMTLLEAGAAGLPMIVTTGGGGPTLLQEGAGGEAVAPADDVALADAILRYAHLPLAARRALGEASAAVVASRYTVEAAARAYVGVYEAARR